jgi:hypothetical protein
MNLKQVNITTFGSDPEFAVVDENNNVVIVESHLPGSKAQPFDIGEGIGVQPDGVAIEMTIPPCSSKEEFVSTMLKAKSRANDIVKAINPNYSVKALSSAKYPLELLQANPKCMQFGCSSSYNAWTLGDTYVPSAMEVGQLRSQGCHFHCGITNLKESDVEFVDTISTLMKTLDIFVGVPSVLIDTDTDRRRIYGTAGDFRYRTIKDTLVVEYRVLGGNFLESEETIAWVFDSIIAGIEHYNENVSNEEYLNCIDECAQSIQDTIKSGNIEDAKTICQIFNVELPKIAINEQIAI